MSRVGVSGAGALFVGDGSGIVRAWDWRRAGAGRARLGGGARRRRALRRAALARAVGRRGVRGGGRNRPRFISRRRRRRRRASPRPSGTGRRGGGRRGRGFSTRERWPPRGGDAAGGETRGRGCAGRDTVRVSPSRASEMLSPRAGTRARGATSPSRRGVWTGSSGYGADPCLGAARAPGRGRRPGVAMRRGGEGARRRTRRRRTRTARCPRGETRHRRVGYFHRAVARAGVGVRRRGAAGASEGGPEEPGPRLGRFTKRNRTRNRTARGRRPRARTLTRAEIRTTRVRTRSVGLWGTRAVAGRRARGWSGVGWTPTTMHRRVGDASARAIALDHAGGRLVTGERETVPSRAPGCPRRRGVVTEGGKGRAEERARIIVYLRKILPQNSRERDTISAPAPDESPLSSLPIGSRAGRRAPHARNPRDEGRRRSRLVGRRGCIALVSTVIPPPLARALERRIERC